MFPVGATGRSPLLLLKNDYGIIVYEGEIPNPKMKLLQAWMELHKEELEANWELTASGQQPYKIDPLR